MKRRQVSIAFTLYLLLMGSAVPASLQAPVPMKPSGELPVLQLDQPVRFLNSDTLPLYIHSGTYQVTTQAPDTLLITSTSTGKAHNLHATSMTHRESLTIPYPFLIAEAEGREHMHIVLLLPNGPALDAEGRMEKIQTRGVGDLTRFDYIPTRQYSWMVMQRGATIVTPEMPVLCKKPMESPPHQHMLGDSYVISCNEHSNENLRAFS